MAEKSALREALFEEVLGDPVSELVSQMRAGTYTIAPEPPSAKFDIETTAAQRTLQSREKREAYAITGYFLEKVSSFVRPLTATGNLKLYPKSIYPPEPHQVVIHTDAYFDPKQPGIFHRTKDLEKEYATQLADALMKWSTALRQEPADSYDRTLYERLAQIASLRTQGKKQTPESYILIGGATIGEVSLSILRAIPVAFHTRFGRTISPDEYRSIAEKAEAVVTIISSLHLQTLHALMQYAKSCEHLQHTKLGLEFPLNIISLEDGYDGTPLFNFTEEALTQIKIFKEKNMLPIGEDRFRCPASYARVTGADGRSKNLISAIYERYRMLAERYIVPALGPYTDEAAAIIDR